jgi:hypothetical protein
MKRLFIILVTALALGGLAYAGGPPGPEQYSWPQEKKIVVVPPVQPDGWTTTNKIAAAGVAVTAIGVVGGLYLNSRRKKQ